jgi:hypothetical protein
MLEYGMSDINFVKLWEALNNLTKVDLALKELINEETGHDNSE